MAIKACPECAAGKCYNCPGDAWDDEADELVDCPCYADGHLVRQR